MKYEVRVFPTADNYTHAHRVMTHNYSPLYTLGGFGTKGEAQAQAKKLPPGVYGIVFEEQ